MKANKKLLTKLAKAKLDNVQLLSLATPAQLKEVHPTSLLDVDWAVTSPPYMHYLHIHITHMHICMSMLVTLLVCMYVCI